MTEITTDIAESLEFIQIICNLLSALELPLERSCRSSPRQIRAQ